MGVSNENRQYDVIGLGVFSLLVIASITQILDKSIYNTWIIVLVAIGISGLYILRVNKLELSRKAPLGDTFIVLSLISIAVTFLVEMLNENRETIITLFDDISIGFATSFVIIGLLVKIFLLEDVVNKIFEILERTVISIKNWILISKLNMFKVFLIVFSTSIYILTQVIESTETQSSKFIILLGYSVLLIVQSIEDKGDQYLVFPRVITLFVSIWGIIIPPLIITDYSKGGYILFFVSLLLWSIRISTFRKLTENIFLMVKSSLQRIGEFVTENTKLFLKLVLLGSGLYILFFGPRENTGNTSFGLNITIGYSLIFLSLVEHIVIYLRQFVIGLYQLLKYYFRSFFWKISSGFQRARDWIIKNPYGFYRTISFPISAILFITGLSPIKIIIIFYLMILSFLPNLHSLGKWLGRELNSILKYLTNINQLQSTFGLVFLISGVIDVGSSLERKFILLLFGSALIVSSQNSFVLSVLGAITSFFALFLDVMIKLIKLISSFEFNRNRVVSLSAWILLFIALTFNLFFEKTDTWAYTRLLLFGLSITLWISAYPKRRLYFKLIFSTFANTVIAVAKSISKTIYNIFRNILLSVIENIIILVSWIIAFSFAILGLAFTVPSILPFENDTVSEISNDFVVSVILTITMVGLAFTTLQQTYIRRESLKLEGYSK